MIVDWSDYPTPEQRAAARIRFQARRWQQAGVARILLFEDAVRLKSGNRWAGEYGAVRIVHHPYCEHLHTVCLECLDSWQLDHVVRLFSHGRNGYVSYACRCRVCAEASGLKYHPGRWARKR
jgi:hypothetical protein